ncbi:MAG: FecR domain-containing protein [Candidatus Omnitrophica bacterium]|nr:FecR domain-containing protein [Candidatus Omnitrophota bacterium]
MKGFKFIKVLSFISALVVQLLISDPLYAEKTKRTAEVIEVEGAVEIIGPDNVKKQATVGMEIGEGYVVKTGGGALAVVYLNGVSETAEVEVKERTVMRIADFYEDRSDSTQETLLDIAVGEILITSKKLQADKSKFQVKTPTSLVGVRGTTFSVSVKARE